NRPEDEIDFEAVLKLDNVAGNLEVTVAQDRIAVERQHMAENVEPVSALSKGMDVGENQDDIVIRERVRSGIRNRPGAGQEYGAHRVVLLTPADDSSARFAI